MRQTIRFNTFETNSSSTHSICICSDEEFNKFKNGKLFFSDWGREFLTEEEAISRVLNGRTMEELLADFEESEGLSLDDFDNEEAFKKNVIHWAFKNEGIRTYHYYDIDNDTEADTYYDENNSYETYHVEYTTKGGEKIHAFGYYGNDY